MSSPGIGCTDDFSPFESHLVYTRKGERAFERKKRKYFLELQEDVCSYQTSLREKLTQVKEVCEVEHRKATREKKQNKGDLEGWFFSFVALCVETWPVHHILLYFYALEVKKPLCPV